MLLNYRQQYQEFAQLLEELQLQAANPQLEVGKLRQNLQKTQQFFQQQILTLAASDLSPAQESQIRSYHTEISKQLQLVGMEATYLQAAKQQATLSNRRSQLASRIQTLISYCNAILELA